jgi:SNF2 family DNA or RNA helicase
MTSFNSVPALLGPENMHMYQDEMVDFMVDVPFCAMFVDLGLGKTVSTMTAMLNLIMAAIDGDPLGIDNWLVIAPLRVANTTWPNEIREWSHTRAMSISHIRDEVLVDAINQAGGDARQLLKAFGVTHPDVISIIRKHRLKQLAHRAKNQLGYRKHDITRYARQFIDEEMKKPLGTAERKIYVQMKRDQAAAVAVREHKRKNPASIYVINREQVEFLVRAWGRDWPFDGVVIDESSAFKDHRTKRWAAIRQVRPLLKRMIQLTATPATETYAHLFGQIGLLDMGERLGATNTAFMERFFIVNKWNHEAKLRPGAEEEIAELIADICLTMKAEDYLPMDAPVFVNRYIDMPESAMQLYRQMESDGLVELNGREIEAATAASMSQKLLQIASGVLYETYLLEDIDTEDMVKVKQIHEVHDRKITDLRELVEETGERILVAYHFKSSLDKLLKAFPKAVVMDKEGSAVNAWNKGKIPILLMHPQSGAHGLNLQKGGRYVYYYDIPWSGELYLQFNARLHRQGQKDQVFICHAVSRGTLDEHVVKCLEGKTDAQEELFKLLKKLQRKMKKRLTIEHADL